MKTRIILLLFVPGLASANDLSLVFNATSVHFGECQPVKCNQKNHGFGIEYSTPQYYLTAGELINSVDDQSYYAGAGQRWERDFGTFRGGIGYFAGLVRYPSADLYLIPAVLPVASLTYDRLSIDATYIPPVASDIVGAVFFRMRVRL
jgi:Antimicrobial peptide resistance and lipid A acylation protein PagP